MLPHLQQLTDAINAASQSILSFAACLLLVLAGIAFAWFTRAEVGVKIGVFVALFVGGFVLLWVVYAPPPPAQGQASVARGNYVIDLQYAGSRDLAQKLMTELQRKGWTVYDVDASEGFRPSIVKYSADSNYTAAEALRSDAAAFRPPVLPIRFARDAKIKPSHLELWVGFE